MHTFCTPKNSFSQEWTKQACSRKSTPVTLKNGSRSPVFELICGHRGINPACENGSPTTIFKKSRVFTSQSRGNWVVTLSLTSGHWWPHWCLHKKCFCCHGNSHISAGTPLTDSTSYGFRHFRVLPLQWYQNLVVVHKGQPKSKIMGFLQFGSPTNRADIPEHANF